MQIALRISFILSLAFAVGCSSSGNVIDLSGSTSSADTVAPVLTGVISDGTTDSSVTQSPMLSWTAADDVGGSGVSYYELAIGVTQGGATTMGWTRIGNVTSYQAIGLSLVAGTTYYPSLRAVDVAGNVSAVIYGDGWIVIASATGPTSTTSVWSHQAYLKASNANASDEFGLASAINGDTIAVGASREDSNQTTITNGSTASSDNSMSAAGAVYVFKRTGSTWVQEAYLKAPSSNSGDEFGHSVAISGDTIVVGALKEDSNQTTVTNGATASADNSLLNSGAAYVFKRTGSSWAQEAFLRAPNSGMSDRFGETVAISGDTVLVGAANEDSNQTTITNGATASADNSILSAGAIYVFKRTGTTWSQEAYIKPANADSGDWFGLSLALSGDTIVAAAVGEDSNQTTITNGTTASSDNSATDTGAVFVFKRTGTNWAQEAYLKPSNGDGGDSFGQSVFLSDDTIVVGAFQEDSNQTTITNGNSASTDNSLTDAGAAYVFKRTGSTWAQEAYLKAPNAEAGDLFGASVAISGDTIVVGCTSEDSNQTTITIGTTASSDNSATSAGAAYVFKRTGITWAQEAYLKAPNADSGDGFGVSVSINDDTIVVGAWNESSNQTTITNGATASSDNSASSSGAAYVFVRSTSAVWAPQAYVKAANAEAGDALGIAVSIDGDTMVAGAFGESSNQTTITNGTAASSDNSASTAGAAYVFKRTGSTWSQEAYLKAPNAEANDWFGVSVAVSGDTIVVGAYQEDSNQTTITNGTTASANNSATSAGAAYVFKRTGSTWLQEAYLKAPNAETNDWFGYSVAISGDTIVVGAQQEDSNQTTITNGTTASANNSATSAGAAYVFQRTGSTWAQEAYLKAPNASAISLFGNSVAISGDTIVVGSYQERSSQTTITNGTTASSDTSAVFAGAVYVFKRTGTTWAQEAYLKAPNAEAGDYFGLSVAISGDTIVSCARDEDSNQSTVTNGTSASADNSMLQAGACYIFKRSGTTWAQEAYLKPSNMDAGDSFGIAVAINGDSVVVGSFGEGSNQTTVTNGTSASSNNSILGAGAAYVFKRSGSTWAQESYLKAPNADASDWFGLSVSLSNDTIAVGAYQEDSNQTTITNGSTASSDNSAAGSGAVYIFQR